MKSSPQILFHIWLKNECRHRYLTRFSKSLSLMLESGFVDLSSFIIHHCFMFKACQKLEPRLWWSSLSVSFCCHHNILFTYLLLTDYTNNVELLKSWFHIWTHLELINKKELCTLLFWVDFLIIFLVCILLLFCNIRVITYVFLQF